MAETLRDLVVSLSLDTNGFATNIKHVSNLMKETKSAFDLAKSGVDGFEKSAEGAGAKLDYMTTTLQQQETLANLYGQALAAAESKLASAVDKNMQLSAAYAQSGAALKAATAGHKELGAALKEAMNSGADPTKIAFLSEAYAESAESVARFREVNSSLGGQLAASDRSVQTLADRVTNASAKFNEAQSAVRETASEVSKMQESLSPAQQRFQQLGETVDMSKQIFSEAAGSIRIAETAFQAFAAQANVAPGSVAYLNEQQSMLASVLAQQAVQVDACRTAYQAMLEQQSILNSSATATQEQINAQNLAVQQSAIALNQAEAAYAKTAAQLQSVEQALTPMAQAWQQAKLQIEYASAAIDSASAGVNLWQSAFSVFQASTTSAPDSLEYLNQQLATLEGVLGFQEQALSAYADKLSAADAQLKSLLQTATATPLQIEQATAAVRQAGADYNKAATDIAKTQKAIRDTQNAASTSGQAWTAQEKAVEAAGKAVKKYEQELQTLKSAHSAERAETSATLSDVEKLQQKYDQLGNQYEKQIASLSLYQTALSEARTQLELAQQSGDPSKIESANSAYNNAATALNRAREAAASTKNEMADLSAKIDGTATGAAALAKAMDDWSDSTASAGRNMYNKVTRPIMDFASESEEVYMTMEMSEAKLRQVTSATEDQYKTVTDAARQMSEELGISASSIVDVMTEVGRLGVDITGSGQDFIDFTSTIEKMALTLGVNAEEAGTSVARFFNLMGNTTDEATNYGSSVTYLANNYATTASEIIEMSQGLAGAAKTVGMSSADILGVSTALTSVGITAGRGATTFSQALVKMETSVQTGDKYLDDFAKVANMSSEQFVKAWKDNPTQAFTAFITGLANMDDATSSSIAALQECGIKTARLTDSFLRIRNSSDQFTKAIRDANTAWKDNSILTNTSEKVIGTLQTRLNGLKQNFRNLKEKIGADLSPAFSAVIGFANGLVNVFSAIPGPIRTVAEVIAGLLAVVGPAKVLIGVIGKIVASSISVFARLAPVVASAATAIATVAGPAIAASAAVAGLTAAAAIATVGFVELATGGYKTVAAIHAINEAAKEWKDTVSDSFWNGEGSGLAAMGLSSDAFKPDDSAATSMKEWTEGLLDVWTDGQAETNAIRDKWINSFKSLTDGTRNELKNLQESASGDGNTALYDQLGKDISALDAMDAEVESLLKKRQNGLLTDDDVSRLNELAQQRADIILKYRLEEDTGNGFDQIDAKIDATKRRAAALGETVDISVYETATKAAAEGYSATTKALDDEYDARLRNIQLIQDTAERSKALGELDAWYVEERQKNQQRYAETLSKVATPVLESDDVANAVSQVDDLTEAVKSYMTASDDKGRETALQKMGEISKTLDEGDLVSYYATLAQIQDLVSNAKTDEDKQAIQSLFPDIDIEGAMTQLAALQEWFSANDSVDGLSGLSEMFTDLGSEVENIAVGLDLSQLAAQWSQWATNPGAIIVPSATITAYDDSGADTSGLKIMSLVGTILSYTDSGSSIDDLSVSGLVGKVVEYLVDENKVHTADPQGLVGTITDYIIAKGYNPETSTPIEVLASIAKYINENADMSEVELVELIAYITGYDVSGADKSNVNVLDAKAHIAAYELTSGTSDNPILMHAIVNVDEIVQNVDAAQGALADNYGWDFIQDSTLDRIERLNSAVNQLGPGGWFGTVDDIDSSSISRIADLANDFEASDFENIGKSIGGMLSYLSGDDGDIDPAKAQEYIALLDKYKQFMAAEWAAGNGNNIEDTTKGVNEMFSSLDVDPETLVATMEGAIDGAKDRFTTLGSDVSEGIGDGTESYDFSGNAETAIGGLESWMRSAADSHSPAQRFVPLGMDISEGVGKGLTDYDFSGAAGVAVDKLMSAIESAIASEGSSENSDSSSATSLMEGIANSITSFDADTSSVGSNLMKGIEQGIKSGRSGVIQAAVQAVADAIAAAKARAGIFSPSRVMRDEVGVMLMKGMGVGITKEAKAASKAMSNAMSYTMAPAYGYVGSGGNDNRRTYNQNSTINLNIDGLSVRDDTDVRSLAIELSSLTKRSHQARGVKG